MTPPEVSKEELFEHMRERAKTFDDVAESLKMNVDACVMTLKNVSEVEPTDAAALGFVKLAYRMLKSMAEDLREIVGKAEAGNVEVNHVVVPMSDIHDGDTTKH